MSTSATSAFDKAAETLDRASDNQTDAPALIDLAESWRRLGEAISIAEARR